jgi:hypothetical protein
MDAIQAKCEILYVCHKSPPRCLGLPLTIRQRENTEEGIIVFGLEQFIKLAQPRSRVHNAIRCD